MQLQGGIGGACGSFHSFAAACIQALVGRCDDVVTMGVVLSGCTSAEMLHELLCRCQSAPPTPKSARRAGGGPKQMEA